MPLGEVKKRLKNEHTSFSSMRLLRYHQLLLLMRSMYLCFKEISVLLLISCNSREGKALMFLMHSLKGRGEKNLQKAALFLQSFVDS